MRPARLSVITAATAIALGSAACEDPVSGCACTEEYRAYSVTVIDGTGNPVPDLTVTRTNLRTGKVLQPGWLGLLIPGVYLVADDGMLNAFSSEGDTLRITGSRVGTRIVADFVFAVPAPCRCHVELLAGADTVFVRDLPLD
jgi:hypothetical protein